MSIIKYSKINRHGVNQVIFRMFNLPIFCYSRCLYGNLNWIRILNIVISWKRKKVGLSFSERMGKRKYITIGKYYYSISLK